MLEPFAGTVDHSWAFRNDTPGKVITPNDKYQYLVKPFTIEINMGYYKIKDEQLKDYPYRLKVAVLVSPIHVDLYPESVKDLASIMGYFEGQMLIPHLRKYRPLMRPYTQEVGSSDPDVRAHRRSIVAQWF